jgi:hypothetical protein
VNLRSHTSSVNTRHLPSTYGITTPADRQMEHVVLVSSGRAGHPQITSFKAWYAQISGENSPAAAESSISEHVYCEPSDASTMTSLKKGKK